MRHEIKFILNDFELLKFKSWIISQTRFKKKYEPRTVNSIYFDDINDSSANDNLAGISLREKYRLRWYNNDFDKITRFEIKKRVNRLNYKEYFDFEPSEKISSEMTNKNYAEIWTTGQLLDAIKKINSGKFKNRTNGELLCCG